MKNRWMKILAFLSFLLLVGCFSVQASAASDLQLKVTTGISGVEKIGKALPVEIEIENTGEAFSGDIVINEAFTYNAGAGIVQHISLEKNENKTLNFLLDQYSPTNGKSIIQIYNGNYKTGDKVSYIGNGEIKTPKINADQQVILSLDLPNKQADLFKVDVANSNTYIYKNSTSFQAPVDARYLDAISLLVVQGETLNNWSVEQQRALSVWVQKGGTLYVQGNSVLPDELKLFQPLKIENNNVELSNAQLNEFFKTKKYSYDLKISQAILNKDAQLLTGDEQTPLLAKSPAGNGWIIQSSYNQFASNQQAFSQINRIILAQVTSTPSEYATDLYTNLANTVELFPEFHFSALIVITVLLLYILVIAPLLYIFLKKKDKREYAWWIIPLGAVVTSVCIFLVSSNGRLFTSKVQQASITTIGEQQSATYFAQSVLTNKSGDIQLNAPENTYMTRFFTVDKMNGIMNKAMLRQTAEESQLELRNLRYWDVATVVGQKTEENLGDLAITLSINEGYLQGEVTNNLSSDLQDATVWSGQKRYALGTIKKGQTIQVKEEIPSKYLVRPISLQNFDELIEPTEKSKLASYQRKKIEDAAVINLELQEQPVIMGWMENEIFKTNYKQLKTKQVNKNLILQSFMPTVQLEKNFTLKNEQLSVEITDLGTDGYSDINRDENQWMIGAGNYEVMYQLPTNFPLQQVTWNELKFDYPATAAIEMAIYNYSQQSYEQLTEKSTVMKKNITDYISLSGTLQFKLDRRSAADDTMKKPLLQLKGAKKDD